MSPNPPRQPHDTIIRLARASELEPRVIQEPPFRRPAGGFSLPSSSNLYGFTGLIILGTLLLALPFSDSQGRSTSPLLALFTATSAVTVTGHTAASTTEHWSHFGQAVIFLLMLVGGLGFMVGATFILELIGRERTSIAHQLVLLETMGEDQQEYGRSGQDYSQRRHCGLNILRNWNPDPVSQNPGNYGLRHHGSPSGSRLFLSVSSFNNAGFSILPEVSDSRSLAILDNQWIIQAVMVLMIMFGGIGYSVLEDIWKKKGA